jgi:hypothetical protein
MAAAADTGAVLRLDRVAYGAIADTAAGMSIKVSYTNRTSSPQNMDFNARFFNLQDEHGRKAELVFFCCSEQLDLIDPGQERGFTLIWNIPPGWSGKEIQAHTIMLRVEGLLPLVRGRWEFPALATASSP